MGNSNSGNHGGKRTTSDMRVLDVRKVQRDGLLTPGQSFSWQWSRGGNVIASVNLKVDTDRVMLDYRNRPGGGEWQAVSYPVRLAWTPCQFGGQRAWWLCPGADCGRRVAVLYGGSVFACRHCHALAYKSQRETPDSRAYRRANNLRARLGWIPGVIHGPGSKPKGMHWKTFWRLHAIHDTSAMQALGGMSAKMDKTVARLKMGMAKMGLHPG
ncbi:hypothetical protein [Polaromonas naphthalenivorans]|uniref:Uncharacterized protein n=1 Tax=Polaromonas naphthalenivorans (strain CJ2) TaxID=365044 RepID=A1VQM9_POLNA|nr:hypothetical protein [Polaromonas naphthalenivorans]ABM37957.1 conserved hypothetical protein [Polaromonas naphthalenivorans CJ2]